MLTCKEIEERVTAYIEHELSWPERMQFKLHVIMCRFCRRYVAQMEATRAALRRLGQRAHPSDQVDLVARDVFRRWRDESGPP